MKMKITLLAFVLLAMLTTPILAKERTITVFEGKILPGEKLIVGNYTVEVAFDTSKNPYIIVWRGDRKVAINRAVFGSRVEINNLTLVIGGYDEKGLTVVVSWKSEGRSYSLRVGRYIQGFKVVNISNSSITLGKDSSTFDIPKGVLTKLENFAFEFNGTTLTVYELPRVTLEKKIEEKSEIIVSYPFEEARIELGKTITVPIVVFNNGTQNVTLELSAESSKGIEVKFLYQGIEVKTIKLRGKETTSLQLLITPKDIKAGKYDVKFSIGNKTYKIFIDVKGKEPLEIITPIISQDSEAGTQVQFPITLLAHSDVIISIESKVPENWESYTLMDGVRIREAYLSSESQKVINLLVEVPRNADLGYHQIELNIVGRDPNNLSVVFNKTLVFGVNVYKTYKGQNATLKLIVVDDLGNPVPRALVKIGEQEYLTDSSGTLEVEIKPGEYNVNISKEGYEQKKESIKLGDGETKEIKITLTRKAYYFTVDTKSDIYPIFLGSPSSFSINIENLGKNDDEYKLELVGFPENWNYIFTESPESKLEITRVKVKAGESRTVYLQVYPSLNAMPGDYNVTIIVKSSSGLTRKVPIKIKLTGFYNMDVRLMNYRLTITAGEEKGTSINIWNFGNAPLTNIKITVNGPQGWEIRVDKSLIPSLPPKGNVNVPITIKVPEGTTAGDYRIRISVKSDQAEWSDTLRVVVKQRSTSTYIGVLILVLAFGLVIFMMRRLGRR
ncbi:COG1470 family protein [Pyrococcus abyssi]|uniref:Alpha-galactosidase NEW3 domain-containing protein n=1 Tax=Pyrococcus abyssi (strain GE5 / Orsay) TaxID=272844 RepID=Q9V0L0_PYRAB|nr:NEW3 domain-containing protein [Pyrococcus abyssi]CAB49693.1 Hypothetical protein PAB2446 [Pyrococcus abyssi GE5]CCE70176.1 TPA: hypothetical protein PAB2446 [Pyrococcus abyssi GE5]